MSVGFNTYDVIVNGVSLYQKGFLCVKRPNMSAPQKRYKSYSVEGRDGSLYKDTGNYEDLELSFTFNYMTDEDHWNAKYREIQSFLSNARTLMVSDDKGGYRKIKKVSVGECKRESKRKGEFTVVFTVEPYFYRDTSIDVETDQWIRLYNPYGTAKPVYHIKVKTAAMRSSNEGFIVRGSKGRIDFVTTKDITIDTELQIAYFTDDKSNANKCISGDFEDMWLENGLNLVACSDGYTLSVEVNWREVG